MTETVLKFLYENRQSLKYNNINHLLVDKKPIDVRYFIRELVKNDFVSMHNSGYDMLGNGNPIIGFDKIELKAKIKPNGERHYLDTYVKKNNSQTFNIDQLVNIGGDNNAPITQTIDHSSSAIDNRAKPTKDKRPMLIKIGKYILGIITTIVTLYTFYEIIKSATNH